MPLKKDPLSLTFGPEVSVSTEDPAKSMYFGSMDHVIHSGDERTFYEVECTQIGDKVTLLQFRSC